MIECLSWGRRPSIVGIQRENDEVRRPIRREPQGPAGYAGVHTAYHKQEGPVRGTATEGVRQKLKLQKPPFSTDKEEAVHSSWLPGLHPCPQPSLFSQFHWPQGNALAATLSPRSRTHLPLKTELINKSNSKRQPISLHILKCRFPLRAALPLSKPLSL